MKPTWAAASRTIALSLVLLVAGVALYAGFVKHVLDRGNTIVDESIQSKSARGPLQLAGTGILCAAASGLVSFGPAIRGRRFAPLLGIGLAAVPAGLVGATAFSIGRTSFTLAGAVAAPSVVTLLIACAIPPRERPGLARFIGRSWMATGFLLGLVLLALFGLELAETVRPRVPWASVFAALALGTLMQMAARFVAMHGPHLEAQARDHQQVRDGQDTAAIRAVAQRLHPYIEEGRGAEAYAALARDMGAAVGQDGTDLPAVAPTRPALPTLAAGGAALLRAAAVALPAIFLVPRLGGPAAVLLFGLTLPWTRRSLAPRGDRLPRSWWLAGALLMAAAGAWAGSQLLIPGVGRLTMFLAAVLALPYLILFAAHLRRHVVPDHMAFLRLEHAQLLARTWARSVRRGLAVAAGAVLLPPMLWLASRMSGLAIESLPWPVLLTVAAAGILWSLAALLAGPAAQRHRLHLAAQHAGQVQARATAHRLFLDRLEMT